VERVKIPLRIAGYPRCLAYNEQVSNDGEGDVTQLLAQWGHGDRAALDAATRLVYSELRKIAGSYLQRESAGHTLQPTALINEAYLRLVKGDNPGSFENRKKFFAFAARLMRQVLVDHARSAGAEKRGGAVAIVPLDDNAVCAPANGRQFLALDDALEKLAQLNPRKARVIELRYFGGLNVEETARMLDVSPATISREQRMAEAWQPGDGDVIDNLRKNKKTIC
jgi:RNA polymerase sigma-70 factor (ECF subfamily)